MNRQVVKRISPALGLALLAGLFISSGANAKKPHTSGYFMQQLRSQAHYDGQVTEVADDWWIGGRYNAGGSTIVIGDDMARRNQIAILDFDTSVLPDDIIIDDAYLEVSVVRYNTRLGDPYLLLGDVNVEMTSPYFGYSRDLEALDWEWWGDYFVGFLDEAYKSNMNVSMQIDPSALGGINLTDSTQFKLYFWDDNDDSLSQGITIASGNYRIVSKRPMLTVYYYYP